MTILDVGCGTNPKGTVNLDKFFKKNPHHRHDYNLKQIKNFTLAEGVKLPFRDKSFDMVYASHILEHLENPIEAVKEWNRVARKYVVINVPNNPTLEEFPMHLYSWSRVSLRTFLLLCFNKVYVFANTPLEDLMRNRIFNRILRIHMIKKPMQRFISRIMGLQLTAVCILDFENQEVKCSYHEDDADICVSPCPYGMSESKCPLRSIEVGVTRT